MKLVEQFDFSRLSDGRKAFLFRLNNQSMQVDITNYGGAVAAIRIKDKQDRLKDIVLGFDDVTGYEQQTAYLGVIAGRYANRIAKGRFVLNGTEYVLATNDGENHLHGGKIGFSNRLWDFEIVVSDIPTLKLKLISADGDEGYPGELQVTVTYVLTDDNQLQITYEAVSDKDTVVNLTNHSYFNLNGHDSGDILNHKLYLNSNRFVRVDEECIPTGELPFVENTPFDFTRKEHMHTIGERIWEENSDLACGNGYDHSFVLKREEKALCHCATLIGNQSGIQMEVYTGKPAVQLYTGNGLDGSLIGKQNTPYHQYAGVCLETQFYPDSPNQKSFPNCVLKAKKSYLFHTNFCFSVLKI